MSRKPIELHDHGLWDDIARTIRPLGRMRSRQALPAATSARTDSSNAGTPLRQQPASDMPKSLPRQRVRDAAPPLASFDRRTAQRLARGQIEPEARIDLHGEGLELARVKLLHFISQQRHLGVRLVLVITGKGASPFGRHTLHGTTHYHSPEREGRLRREVPNWLHEEQFRTHAVGFQPAHPRHGGGGAFYVRLRRAGVQD